MIERPILFSAPMVRALLDGRKTQTRRVLKQATGPSLSVGMVDEIPGVAELSWLYGDGPGHDVHEAIRRVPCPYGKPGDRLFVREAYSGPHIMTGLPPRDWNPETPLWYWADGEPTHGDWTKPKPGMHLPRWGSRIVLEVTDVRVEHLQEISDEDLACEGLQEVIDAGVDHDGTPRDSWRALWTQINGPESWAANPWVWVVEFKVVKP